MTQLPPRLAWAVFRHVDGDGLSFLAGEDELTAALEHLNPISPTPYTNGCDCLLTLPECP